MKTWPGYPLNQEALVTQDAFEGRDVVEFDFDATTLEVGGLKAIDYFEDGTFYILRSTGHSTCIFFWKRVHTREHFLME